MKKKSFKILSDNRTILMGIAMLSIIVFHFTQDQFRHGGNTSGFFSIYKTYIGSVGVDIFLLLSAFGLYYSMKKNNDKFLFYYKRYTKIIIPYLLVAIPFFTWLCIYKKLPVIMFFKEISFYELLRHNHVWYWFIFFICICYFIFPFLFKFIDSSKSNKEVVWKIVLLSFTVTLFSILVYNTKVFVAYNIMLLRFFPFFIGLLLGYFSYQKKEFKMIDYIIILLGLIFFVFTSSKNLIIQRYSLFIFNMSLFFLIVFLIDFLNRKKILYINKIIEWLGKCSLEIYLLHVTFRSIFREYGLRTCEFKWFIIYISISLLMVPLLSYISKKMKSMLDLRYKIK